MKLAIPDIIIWSQKDRERLRRPHTTAIRRATSAMSPRLSANKLVRFSFFEESRGDMPVSRAEWLSCAAALTWRTPVNGGWDPAVYPWPIRVLPFGSLIEFIRSKPSFLVAHVTGDTVWYRRQISFFSTSPELSSKQRFEYFSRTIPSDEYQVKAMMEIVKRLNWTYISIIYEESNYGIKVRKWRGCRETGLCRV